MKATEQLSLSLGADLAPGLHFCHRCNRRARWAPVRGQRSQRCDECGSRFPCRKPDCDHQDCAAARAAGLR